MTKRQRRPTIEEIQADPKISETSKKIMNECPIQNIKPQPLVQWVREVFQLGRRLDHDNGEIANWVMVYASSYGWARKQINAVLEDYD